MTHMNLERDTRDVYMYVFRQKMIAVCFTVLLASLAVRLAVVSIETKLYTVQPQLVQHSSQFDIVYIWISKFKISKLLRQGLQYLRGKFSYKNV